LKPASDNVTWATSSVRRSGVPPDREAVFGIGTNLPEWPWTLIVVGVAVSALTVAFSEGARLKQDVAGVV